MHSYFVHFNMVLKWPDDYSSESKHVVLKYNLYYMLCVD